MAGRRAMVCAGAALALLVGCLVAVSSVAQADHTGADRVETPVHTSSPITGVAESMVRVRIPLPASVGPHPAACDWLSYLRWRDADGPTDAQQADRILVAQPGILEGAGAFDSVARNTVAAAAARGRHIEFWALDRRSNCLEDHTGVRAGLAAGDPDLAVDYYYHHASVDGRTFAGYLPQRELGWLGHIGMAQTVRDEYDLLREELPDPAVRQQKVLCGGHSLGGVVTAFFAEWDFDGNPNTTADAGYRQCAGYFALDTTISTSMKDLTGLGVTTLVPQPRLGYAATQAAYDAGTLPRSLSLPALINAETMNVLGIAGLAADVAPDGESDLAASLPRTVNLGTTLRLLFSRNAVAFATGKPAVRDFDLTNDAVLGGLLDNNSMPLKLLETSDGFFDGGPIAPKDFPTPHAVAQVLGNLPVADAFIGTDALAIPDSPHGPLYTWRNYDRIGAPDDPGYTDRRGKPYATPDSEVTDINELARSMAEQPLDFTEQYFPTKLVTDIYEASAPQIASHAVHTEGLTANPTINLLAGSGLVVGNGMPSHGETVVAPGYHHLDVVTAAARQNNGRPEPISTNLAEFALGTA